MTFENLGNKATSSQQEQGDHLKPKPSAESQHIIHHATSSGDQPPVPQTRQNTVAQVLRTLETRLAYQNTTFVGIGEEIRGAVLQTNIGGESRGVQLLREKQRERMETNLVQKEMMLITKEIDATNNALELRKDIDKHKNLLINEETKITAVKKYWLHLQDQEKSPWDIDKWIRKAKISQGSTKLLRSDDSYGLDKISRDYGTYRGWDLSTPSGESSGEVTASEIAQLADDPDSSSDKTVTPGDIKPEQQSLESKQKELGLWETELSNYQDRLDRVRKDFQDLRGQFNRNKIQFRSEKSEHLESVSLDEVLEWNKKQLKDDSTNFAQNLERILKARHKSPNKEPEEAIESEVE